MAAQFQEGSREMAVKESDF